MPTRPNDDAIVRCLRDTLAYIDAGIEVENEHPTDPDRKALLTVERGFITGMIAARMKVMNAISVKRRR